MKAVVQRVSHASVTEVSSKKVVGSIGTGIFILIGVRKGDTDTMAVSLANKISKLRIFEETHGKMSSSAIDSGLSALVVSQFTLLANTSDGNRPSFLDAEEPVKAKRLYELFVTELERFIPVQKGSFGNYMQIDMQLDGPVTITFEQ